jgi:hypothetical protein
MFRLMAELTNFSDLPQSLHAIRGCFLAIQDDIIAQALHYYSFNTEYLFFCPSM